MNEWPKTGACTMCEGPFLQYRPRHAYCTENGCKQAKARERWRLLGPRETDGALVFDELDHIQANLNDIRKIEEEGRK